MARIGAVQFLPVFRGFQDMASMKKLLLLVTVTMVATASFALDRSQMTISGSGLAARGGAPQTPSAVDVDMQAICREVLVDIDQGYGVSSREARFVCGDKRR